MTGKKLLVLSLAGMLTLGMGTWSAAADTAAQSTSQTEEADTAAQSTSQTEEAGTAAQSSSLTEEAAELAKDAAEMTDETSEDGIAGIYKMSEESLAETAKADKEDLELVQAIGGMMRLVLLEDGTGSMNVMGQETKLEWNEKEIIMEGEGAPYTYKDGVLTLGAGSQTMSFRKMTEEELEEDESGPLEPGDYDPDTRAGYYKLSTLEENGEVTDASILAVAGMEVYLVLNEDNTGRLSLFDMPMELTWNDKVMTMDGEDAEYTYDAGKIVMEAENVILTFVYAGAPDEAPEPAAEETADSAAAAESETAAESTASSETAAESTTSAEEAAK